MLKLFKQKIASLRVITEKHFNKKMDRRSLQLVFAFIVGVGAMFLIASTVPEKVVIVKSPPVVKIIEKEVIVKKPVYTPVYISSNDRNQIQCLAENAYFEAGNQSTKGKAAVTHVVMNRVEDKRFPKTPCAVVYQKTRGTCQFSWVCEGNKSIRNADVFAESKRVAEQVYIGNIKDVTRGAKFYHANYVNPGWNMTRVATIGAHIFYRG
jgi:spore germination cell wall hydrolase CwlJ-like protein